MPDLLHLNTTKRLRRFVPLISASLLALSYLPSASALCLFGSIKGESQDFKNSYWESVEKSPGRTVKQVTQQCTLAAAAEKQGVTDAYLELCRTGQLTGGNRLFAERLLSNPLWFGNIAARWNPPKSSDQSAQAWLTWSVTNSDNPQGFKEDCGWYVAKTAENRDATLLGSRIEHHRKLMFSQCMTQNQMREVVPTKPYTQCKSIGW